jgi:hypothetical protein
MPFDRRRSFLVARLPDLAEAINHAEVDSNIVLNTAVGTMVYVGRVAAEKRSKVGR